MVDSPTARARAERMVVSALCSAPPRVLRLIGGPVVRADGTTIEPEVGAALRLLNALPGSAFEELPLDQLANRLGEAQGVLAGVLNNDPSVTQLGIPGVAR